MQNELQGLKSQEADEIERICRETSQLIGSESSQIRADLDTVADLDAIFVPVGGGGLIGGIATAVKKINPNIRVIGVQTSACPAMLNSIKDNVCYTEYLSENSICTALIGGVGIRGFEICKKYVDDIILVEENEILLALKYAILNEHHLIEPSSAVTIAAELFHKKKIGGKNIALVISGGNIDGDMIKKAIL